MAAGRNAIVLGTPEWSRSSFNIASNIHYIIIAVVISSAPRDMEINLGWAEFQARTHTHTHCMNIETGCFSAPLPDKCVCS